MKLSREQLKKLIAEYTEQGGKITQLRPGSARAVTPKKWKALEEVEKALETQPFAIPKGIGKVGQGKGKIYMGGETIKRGSVTNIDISKAQIEKLEKEGFTIEQIESAVSKINKNLNNLEARTRFKKQPLRKLLRTLRDAHPNIKKALLGKKKKPKKQTKALWKAPKKTRQAIKRNMGGPVHRGTGAALRGFGNAKYSNRLY